MSHGVDRVVREPTRYLDLLKPGKFSQKDGDDTSVCGLHTEELLTMPFFSWSVKLALADDRKRGQHAPSISPQEWSTSWRRLGESVGQATAVAAVAMRAWRSRYETVVAGEESQAGRGDFVGIQGRVVVLLHITRGCYGSQCLCGGPERWG